MQPAGRLSRPLPREDLHEVAREDHREADSEEEQPGGPPLALSLPDPRQGVAAQQQPHREDRDGRGQDVRRERRRLPWMAHAGIRVGIGEEVLRHAVKDPADGNEPEAGADDPRFPARHRRGRLERTWWRARTRRAASVVARAVRVAPETGRMPRLTESSSSSALPGNCAYQCSRGRNSSGSEKERTSILPIVPAGVTTTISVSARVRTTCVSKYAVPTIAPSFLAT